MRIGSLSRVWGGILGGTVGEGENGEDRKQSAGRTDTRGPDCAEPGVISMYAFPLPSSLGGLGVCWPVVIQSHL